MKWPLGGYTKLDRLLGEKGIPKDSEAGRRQFGSQMERLRGEGTHRFRFNPPQAIQSGVSPVPRQPPHCNTSRQFGRFRGTAGWHAVGPSGFDCSLKKHSIIARQAVPIVCAQKVSFPCIPVRHRLI
jgi:hypothetical protein